MIQLYDISFVNLLSIICNLCKVEYLSILNYNGINVSLVVRLNTIGEHTIFFVGEINLSCRSF